jgi:hypothetical protein
MWDKVIIASLIWFITFYKFGAMWRGRQRRKESVTFYFWIFLFFTAIGLTLLIWPVYLGFNQFLGLPNFGWLVTYMAFSLAIYAISSGCYIVVRQSRPPIMDWSLVATLGVLLVIYALGVVNLPEKPDHTIPETWSEMLFMQIFYVYMAAMCAMPITTFIRLFEQEQIMPTKLRWLVAVLATLFSFVTLLIKIALTLLTFLDPVTPALAVLHPMVGFGIVIAGVFCLLAFLPNGGYLAAARPIEFLGKYLAFHELRVLRARLDVLCPPVINADPRAIDALRNLDFHLYRTVIAILDAKKMLACYIDTAGVGALPAHMTGQMPEEWDMAKVQRACLLSREMQKVNDHQPYESLIKSYQKASRIVNWRLWLNLLASREGRDVAYQS